MSEQAQNRISDERLAWVANHPRALDVLPSEASDIACELQQARRDLKHAEEMYIAMRDRCALDEAALYDRDQHIKYTYSALDGFLDRGRKVNRSIYLFDHVRKIREKWGVLRASHKRLVEALSWALDLLDMYDKKLVEMGEPKEMVYAAVHLTGKAKARAALAEARKLEGK